MRRIGLGLIILFGALRTTAAANLVYNGDFEVGIKSNRFPDGWSEYMYDSVNKLKPQQTVQEYRLVGGIDDSRCIEVGHSYERFVELEYGSLNYARYRSNSDKMVPLDPNQYYRFSVWYKTHDIEDQQACVELDMFHNGTYIDSRIYHLPPSGTYTQFSTDFTPFRPTDRGFENNSAGANQMRIKLGVVTSLGTAFFDNCSVEQLGGVSDYKAEYPLTNFTPDPLTARRSRAPMLEAKGVWSIQKDANSAWWMVDPYGKPIWMRGMQNTKILQHMHPQMFDQLAAQFKDPGETQTNFAYRMDSWQRIGGLKFNSGGVTDGAVTEQAHPKGEMYFHYFCPDAISDYPASYLLKNADGNYNTLNKPMPDPYNQAYRTWLRDYIRGELDNLGWYADPDHKSHPDFAGYWTDNEMGPEHLDEFIWSTDCAAHFVEWCRTRYNNDPSALNAAWSSQYASFNIASFDDLLLPANKEEIIRHHIDDPLWPVLRDYIKEVLKEYYRLQCGIIREYEVEKLGDANGDGVAEQKHLIATNRFAFSKYPYRYDQELELAMQAIAELTQEAIDQGKPGYYFDFLALNAYPGDGTIEGVTTKENFEYMEKLAQQSGLPVLVSDFSAHGRDCGFPTGNDATEDIGWYYRQVDTQADRAMMYDKMIRQWASSPQIIGAQWFQWSDIMQSTSGALTIPVPIVGNTAYQGRNCGVVDGNNNFYSVLTNQMLATNSLIDEAFLPKNAASSAWLDAQ